MLLLDIVLLVSDEGCIAENLTENLLAKKPLHGGFLCPFEVAIFDGNLPVAQSREHLLVVRDVFQ